jgi:hypothetical protein
MPLKELKNMLKKVSGREKEREWEVEQGKWIEGGRVKVSEREKERGGK